MIPNPSLAPRIDWKAMAISGNAQGMYALKVRRGGMRAEWHVGLRFADAVGLASVLLETAERDGLPRYITATIYENAMVVATFRYYPPSMRRKERSTADEFGTAETSG